MKKIYPILVLLFSAMLANATIHQISVSDFQFAPQTVNAVCGDTIQWNWVSGTHTTTSVSVPPGAATWNANITAFSGSFEYKVTVVGNYAYVCTPHSGMGMVGAIVVTCTNDIADINNGYQSLAYPNPFSDKLTIEFPGADLIAFYNVLGEKVKTVVLSNTQTKAEISHADIRKGIYFYSIIKEGVIVETRKVVKN